MRLLSRLDIKNDFVIKGIQLEGLRKVGRPMELAQRYYEQGIQELVLMDAVASLYDRNSLFPIISEACKEVFIPIAVGGGLRTVGDVEQALRSGADKVIINTAAIKNIGIITECALKWGSQCVVASIEAKWVENDWYAFFSNGRENSGNNVFDWSRSLEAAGCGEILVTSVDRDGTQKGFDVDLIEKINLSVNKPIIASGGMGSLENLSDLLSRTEPSAIAIGSAFHYNKIEIGSVKRFLDGSSF